MAGFALLRTRSNGMAGREPMSSSLSLSLSCQGCLVYLLLGQPTSWGSTSQRRLLKQGAHVPKQMHMGTHSAWDLSGLNVTGSLKGRMCLN